MPANEELKPCPFCGGDAKGRPELSYVACQLCGGYMDSVSGYEDAVKHWNTRTKPKVQARWRGRNLHESIRRLKSLINVSFRDMGT
jgi:hypothetical protein